MSLSPSDPAIPIPAAPKQLRPADCRVALVTFVPFLRPSAVSGMAQVDGGHARLLADLALWGYSDQLTDQLREHLPHRAARVVVAKGGSHQAMQELGLGDWETELALLDVWSFGVGMVTFVDRLRVVDDVSWSQVREDLTSSAAKRLWLSRATGLGAGPVGGRLRPSVCEGAGAPLWTQQMIIVEADRKVGEKKLDAVARVLTANAPRLQLRVGMANTSLRLGVEACAVSNPGVVDAGDALARVVATQTAIWAAAIDLDRLLKARLDAEDAPGLPLERLEERSRGLLGDFQRVQRFRAEIEIIEIHLAPRDKQVWQSVCTEWSLVDQITSLSAKLDAVQHVYRNLADVMTGRQARFLNNVVLAVTTLSLATFLLAVGEYVQKRFDPFDRGATLFVLASVVISIVVFSGVWWRGRRRVSGTFGHRRRRRDHPST